MRLILFLLVLALVSWHIMIQHITGCSTSCERGIEDITFLDFGDDDTADKEDITEIQEETVTKTAPVDVIKTVYVIRKVKTVTLYATCYSQEDSHVERKGIYANQKYAGMLSRSERRINRTHYTVALNYHMRQYHEALININGTWTHKYRMHVPDYNTGKKPDFKISGDMYIDEIEYMRIFNDPYFSVPRDRMGNKKEYANRIDVLFTTAGNYASIKQRQKAWARKNTHNTPVEIWEIQKLFIYKDGTIKESEE